MKKSFLLFFGVFFVLTVFLAKDVIAAAGINRKINFQGKVVKTDGTNVTDNNYNFQFSLWTTATVGTSLWSEVWNTGNSQIGVSSGIFSVDLGTYSTFPPTVDFNSDTLYLSIGFSGEADMSPRIRMTAVPYAFNAEKVGGLTVTNTTGTLTIPNGKTISFADGFTTVGAGITLDQSLATTNSVSFAGLSIGGSGSVSGNMSIGGSLTLGAIPLGTGTTILYINSSGILSKGTLPAGINYTATNGLNLNANAFGLGGTLTQNTQIGTSSFTLSFMGLGNSLGLSVGQSGFVGIGTSSPDSLLSVSSSISGGFGTGVQSVSVRNTSAANSATTIGLYPNSGSDFDISIWGSGATPANKAVLIQRNNAPFGIYTNNTERLSIIGSGNVGLGTTNPGYKLQVIGDVGVSTALTVGTSVSIGSNLTVGGTVSFTGLPIGTGTSIIYLGASGNLLSGTLPAGSVYTATNGLNLNGSAFGLGGTLIQNTTIGTSNYSLSFVGLSGNQSLFIGSSGYVGIGTTNPKSLFQVVNLIGFSGSSTYVGQNAFGSSTAAENSAFGGGALFSNTSGQGNSAFGYSALVTNRTGYYNTALGDGALYYNRSGQRNIAIGWGTLYMNSTGSNNIAIGNQSLYENLSDNNVALGHQSGYYSQTGINNVFIGTSAAYGSIGYSGADNNTIVGAFAGVNIGETQVGNVFLGYQAGYNEKGSNKLYIANNDTSPLIYGDFSTGYVGLGTTNPSQRLDISGSVNIGGSLVVGTNLSVGGSVAFTNTPISVGTTVLFIDATGKITKGYMSSGVGTTYAASNGLNMVVTNTLGLGGSLIQNTTIGTSSFSLSFLGQGGIQALFVGTSGYVGIGTTNPQALLDVNGNASIKGELNLNNFYITNGTQPGDSNFIGYQAGLGATSASSVNFFGFQAGFNATGADNSNFLGAGAGLGATSASNSNFFGAQAGRYATGAYGSNFFGTSAGVGASNANYSNFFGGSAGRYATGANNSNFLGAGAGQYATSANLSNFFGQFAGVGATYANGSNFFGYNAGRVTNAYNSNFFGYETGRGAVDAYQSNFLGYLAGVGASGANNSNFFGESAGAYVAKASFSNFFGLQAGSNASAASNSNFFGTQTGVGASGATKSNFFGWQTGVGATNASDSIFIGSRAGYQDTVNNGTTGVSIAIGRYAGTGGFSNSIAIGRGVINTGTTQVNIGNVVYINGIYNSDTQSGAAVANSSVGIGTTNPTKKLSVAGDIKLDNNFGLYFRNSTNSSDVLSMSYSSGNNLQLSNAEGNINFNVNHGAGNITFDNNWATTMVLTPSNDVGIGTTNPGGRLDVKGGLLVLDNGDFGTPVGVRFRETTDTTTPNGAGFYQANDDQFYFQLGSSNLFNIKNNSNDISFSYDAANNLLYLRPTAGIKPAGSDSITALQIMTVGNDPYVNFDSTNQRVGIGTTNPTSTLTLGSGQIHVPNGTATAPSYSFSADTQMGVYRDTTRGLSLTGGDSSGGQVQISMWTRPGTIYLTPGGGGYPGNIGYQTYITADNNSFDSLALMKGSGDTNPYTINGLKARGSVASPSVITTGDSLLRISALGYVGATSTYQEATRISSDSTGTISDSETGIGGVLRFYTANVGSEVVERLTILSNGNVGIGKTNPQYALDVQTSNPGSYVMSIKNIGNTSVTSSDKGLLISLGLGNSRPATNYYVAFSNAAGTVSGKIQGRGTGNTGVAYTAASADYAEYFRKYNSSESMPYGSLVQVAGNNTVTKSISGKALGVISDSAGFIGNSPMCQVGDEEDCDIETEKYNALVGMMGQIRTLVSTENGPIAPGDPLTVSSTPGVATKAIKAGYTVGHALESYNGPGIVRINSYINPSWYDPDVFISKTGQISINYKVSDSVLTSLGYTDRKNELETASYSLTDSAGNAVSRIGQFEQLAAAKINTGFLSVSGAVIDNLAAKKIVSEEVKTNNLISNKIGASEASFSAVTTDMLIIPEGNISDVIATKINDLREEVKNIMVGQTLNGSNLLSGLNFEDVQFNYQSKLDGIKYAVAILQTENISPLIDSNGNPVEIKIDGNVKINGVLTVDSIKTNSIEGLDVSDQIASLNEKYNQLKSDVLGVNSSLAMISVASTGVVSPTPTSEPTNFLTKVLAEFWNKVLFKGETEFEKNPLFNKDTAGLAILNVGETGVEVKFDNSFEATPIVNISLIADSLEESQSLSENYVYYVANRNQNGFVIRLNKAAKSNIKFSWTALLIKDVKTSQNQVVPTGVVNQEQMVMPTITVMPTPEPTIVPTTEPTIVPTLVPTLEPTLAPTPTEVVVQ